MARSLLQGSKTVHFTSPGIRPADFPSLLEDCDYISFNSLGQLAAFGPAARASAHCGLRVKPALRYITDRRYDPAGPGSRLGVPIDKLASLSPTDPLLGLVSGVHVHNNCDAVDFAALTETTQHLESKLGNLLHQAAWVNLGGGYLFDETPNVAGLVESVERLRALFGVDVFLEPGAAIVRKSGYLISTVLDLVETEEGTTAVLDTSVNHFPEVFEYQFEPEVLGHSEADGTHEYVFAGSTCLAGDVLGTYCLEEPLNVGDRVCFLEAGAYSVVKAHYFNGVNLPGLWFLTTSGDLVAARRFSYDDFRSRYGGGQQNALV